MESNNLTTDQTDPPPYPALTRLYCPQCAIRGYTSYLCSISMTLGGVVVEYCRHCKGTIVFQVVVVEKIALENPVPQ